MPGNQHSPYQHEPTDTELLELVAAGDRSAFESLYIRHWQALYNTAHKRLKNEEQCQDIVQDVFADPWLRREKVNAANLQAFLHTAVRYQVYKLVTRGKASDSFFEPFEAMLAGGKSADFDIHEKELHQLFQHWLQTLPEKRRAIFLLFYADNLTTQQIADKLNISQKTVQNQLGTAKDSLRQTLLPAMLLMLHHMA